MMTLAVPNVPSTPRRVKVYELKDSDWFDRGTGYCTGVMVNVGIPLLLFACSRARAPEEQMSGEHDADKGIG